MVHYPRAFCFVEDDPGAFGGKIIRIIDNMGTCLGLYEYEWFNVTWNYDRRYLIQECERQQFQVGINKIK